MCLAAVGRSSLDVSSLSSWLMAVSSALLTELCLDPPTSDSWVFQFPPVAVASSASCASLSFCPRCFHSVARCTLTRKYGVFLPLGKAASQLEVSAVGFHRRSKLCEGSSASSLNSLRDFIRKAFKILSNAISESNDTFQCFFFFPSFNVVLVDCSSYVEPLLQFLFVFRVFSPQFC